MAIFGLLLPLVALTACGGGGDVTATGGAPAPATAPKGAAGAAPGDQPKPAQAPGLAALATASGFTPLPSPQQVIEPLAQGRQDPFAPLPLTLPLAQARPATPSLPAGFLFTGVIQSRGLTQAIVYLGGGGTTIPESGSSGVGNLTLLGSVQPNTTLCVGPRGICPGVDPSDSPLPPGWSVTGIDLGQGLLSMRQGRMPVTCRLVQPSLRAPFEPSWLSSRCTGQAVRSLNAAAASASSSSANPPVGPGQPGSSPNGAFVPPAGTPGPAPNSAPGASGTGR